MKKEKTPNLDNVQKSRYRLSSEYFTKGASEWVRNSAKNFGFGGVYDFQKKLEEEKQRVLTKREEQKKIKKQKTPFDKYLIGLKIGAFVAASVALVAAFNKINSLFDDGKRKAKEITNDINNVTKEKIGFDLAQVDDYISPFVTKISESVKTDIINPIQTGLDKLFGVGGEEKQYSSLTESGLSENQKKYGIVGCVFRDVALAALRRTLIRRGYGLLISFFNIDDPSVRNEIDLTFWNYYKSPANTFFHVGRDLVSSGIRGTELYNDDFQKRLSLVKGEVKRSHTSFDEYMGFVKTFDSTVNENTIDKIIENIGQNNEKAISQMPDFQFILPKYVVTKKQKTYTESNLQGRREIQVEETKDYTDEEMDAVQFRDASSDEIALLWMSTMSQYKNLTRGETPQIFSYMNYFLPEGEENKNLKQIIKYTQDQWSQNAKFLPEQLYRQLEIAHNVLIEKKQGEPWQWTAKKYYTLIQMFNFFSKWELYQGVRSIHSARMLLQDFVKEQEVEVTYNAVRQMYNEDKRLADKFVIDYTKGNLTIEQFSSKLLESLEQKKALGILENDLKFGILEIQKKIPYGKYKSDLWNIRKKIQEMSVSGVDTKDVTVINYQSFREAMKVDKNYDRNSKIEGRQFGYQYVPDSSGDVFSGDENVKVLLGNEGKPYFYVAMWRTYDDQGHRGKWTNGFVGYKKTDNLENIEQLDTYSTSVYATSGNNDTKNHENIKKDNLKLLGGEPAKVTYNYRYYVPMRDDWQEAKKDLYLYIYEERVGYKVLNRYETVDDDGNFFLQDIWSYYRVGEDGKKTWMGYVYGEKTKSKKSLPSIFQGEYDEKDLETLYNLPQEVLFQRLTEARDYISDKLQQVFQERYQIFSEMKNKLSQNEK